jgi:hypothetical protein
MALSVVNKIASLAAQNQLTITNANLQKARVGELQVADGSLAQVTTLLNRAVTPC